MLVLEVYDICRKRLAALSVNEKADQLTDINNFIHWKNYYVVMGIPQLL
jgi:hypothetical protein